MKIKVARKAFLALILLHASAITAAAGHEDDFKGLYDQLVAWTGGTLGKSIALLFLLIGLGAGVLRGSVVAAITCLAAALALVIAPDIITSIFAGTAG